ncbi:hypothetical protein HanRHA438_Chr13g0581531 [Helianthus annuus]|nr:hypothetical protein HanIR_Chr13g0621111 [Helianthus annuus]KAJ0856713.1 hypothetical protein HanRHA438_Chr13g0581531 [Helianthus annuus]
MSVGFGWQGVYFGWSGVFGCNYVGQRYGYYGSKLVPCRLVLLGKVINFFQTPSPTRNS